MFALFTGCKPVAVTRAQLARSAALVAILGLAGCASDPNAKTAQNMSPQVMADAGEMEADGLPVQSPPPARVRQAPDDPSEPFSRNYGGVNPSAVREDKPPQEHYEQIPVVPAQAMKPPLPDDLPEEFRRKLVHAMAETEE